MQYRAVRSISEARRLQHPRAASPQRGEGDDEGLARRRRRDREPLGLLTEAEVAELLVSPEHSEVVLSSIPDPWQPNLELERQACAVYANLLRSRAIRATWVVDLSISISAILGSVFAAKVVDSWATGQVVGIVMLYLTMASIVAIGTGSAVSLRVVPQWRSAGDQYRKLAASGGAVNRTLASLAASKPSAGKAASEPAGKATADAPTPKPVAPPPVRHRSGTAGNR